MKLKLLLLLVVLSVLPGCLGCGTGGPDEPAPVIRPQEGKELCGQACQHMKDLACQEARPVLAPNDILTCTGADCPELVSCDDDAGPKACVSCVWFCQYQHDNGVTWNNSCLLGISNCTEIESVCNP